MNNNQTLVRQHLTKNLQQHLRNPRRKERRRQICCTGRHHHTSPCRCDSLRYVHDAIPCHVVQLDTSEHLLIVIYTGNSDSVAPNQDKMKGVSTGQFARSQSDQKVDSGSKFLKAQLGDDKGK